MVESGLEFCQGGDMAEPMAFQMPTGNNTAGQPILNDQVIPLCIRTYQSFKTRDLPIEFHHRAVINLKNLDNNACVYPDLPIDD